MKRNKNKKRWSPVRPYKPIISKVPSSESIYEICTAIKVNFDISKIIGDR